MKLGSRDVENMMLGTKQIEKVYKGSQVVWEKSGLPSGYTEVKYLQSSGTQFINTLYNPNSSTTMELEYLPVSSYSTFMCIFGTQNSTSSQRFYGLISAVQYYLQLNFSNSANPNVWGFNSDGTAVTGMNGTFTPNLVKTNLIIDKNDVKIKAQDLEVNCSMAEFPTWGRNVQCDYNLALFSRNTAGTFSNNFKGNIYYCKIWDNGTLQRNFIPCLDTNNTPCFYDTVTGNTYYNQGTGQFGYETMNGTVVNPS